MLEGAGPRPVQNDVSALGYDMARNLLFNKAVVT
jgi:hypothetical protein